jgi:hypothetical protein
VTTDPLAPLLDLADIAPAVERARDRVDQALRHRALRRQGGQVAAEVSLRSAVASAALEGYAHEREAVRAGTVTDPVLQARCGSPGPAGAGRTLAEGPRQALAAARARRPGRLTCRAAGRPVADRWSAPGWTACPDWSPAAPRCAAGARRGGARRAAGTAAVRRPVRVVARAAARLVLMSTGFDPRGLVGVDVGHREREPEYVGSAGAFATGTPDGSILAAALHGRGRGRRGAAHRDR